MSFLVSLQRFIIGRMNRNHPVRDKVQIKNFDKLKKVCLLTSLSADDSAEEFMRIKKQFATSKKEIDILVYIPYKELPDELVATEYEVLSRRDLNRLGILKKGALNGFRNKTYDMLLYYNPESLIPLEHAARLVNALIYIGPHTTKGFDPDIVIHTKSKGRTHFVDTVNNYLKNINKSL